MTKERARANNTAMSRRTLLSSLPATGAALAMPLPAAASDSEDPILPLYREWTAAKDEWDRLAELDIDTVDNSPEGIAAEKRELAAFWAIIDMTPVSLEGIAALAHVLWYTEGPHLSKDHPEYAENCDWPGNKLIRAIWRASSGKSGLPGSISIL